MMRKKNYFKAVIAAVLIAAMLCGSALASSYGAKVFSSSMSVYRTESTRSKIGALGRGTSFTVTSISGDWAKISYKGQTGYAKLSNIVFNKHVKAVTTNASSIRFVTKKSYRTGTYYTGTLSAGVTIYLAGINGSYYLFYDESGSAMGYVKKSAVRAAD